VTALPRPYLDQFFEPGGYLEFASTGPVSRLVQEAVTRALEGVTSPSGPIWESIAGSYDLARAAAARLLGVTTDQVTPVPSTSAGLFQAAFGLIGRPGNVVVPAHEFPANIYPWLRAAAVGGPEVRLIECPDGRVTPERIAAAVDPRTVAVSVSLVDFVTGFRVDVPALRAACRSALLVVDAIQGLGAVETRLEPADVLVAGGQKWLRAGWGSGVMAAGERAWEFLAPTLTGWWGVEDFLDFSLPAPHPPRPSADRYQVGSPAVFGALQLGAAIEVIELGGIGAIEAVIRERVAALEEEVHRAGAEVLAPWRGPEERAGILCCRLPGEDPAVTAARLAAAGLVVSRRSGWVRLAPHASTPPETAARVGEALAG
jgi:selenocysteine lyase/cysteine desulfurase